MINKEKIFAANRTLCHVLLYYMISICLFTIFACSNDKDDADGPLGIQFSISSVQVEEFSTDITITHTGTNRLQYYVFTVQGEVDDIYYEIQKHRDMLLKESITYNIYDQKKRVVKLAGLIPETNYTCIVYGVGDNGNIVGKPSYAYFRTKPCSIHFEQNPRWKLTYIGQGKHSQKTYSKINVSVDEEMEEMYFTCVYSKQCIDQFNDLSCFLLYAYNEFLVNYNSFNEMFYWDKEDYICRKSSVYYKYLSKGDYQAFTIGVDNNGKLTGLYACSDIISFDHYELEPGYESLLGDWEIDDGSGGKFIVKLIEQWANSSLIMSGWGRYDCPIVLDYITSSGKAHISISYQKTECRIKKGDIIENLYLNEWYEYKDKMSIASSSTKILASATIQNNNTFTFTSRSVGGILLTYYDLNHKVRFITDSKIKYPFTMTKVK